MARALDRKVHEHLPVFCLFACSLEDSKANIFRILISISVTSIWQSDLQPRQTSFVVKRYQIFRQGTELEKRLPLFKHSVASKPVAGRFTRVGE